MGLRLNNKYLGKIKRILRCAPTLRPQDFPPGVETEVLQHDFTMGALSKKSLVQGSDLLYNSAI